MIELRDYQLQSVEALRCGQRAGHRRQVLVAPTGAGKTVMGAYLLQRVQEKGTKATFVVDRVALCDQTSRMLQSYGIEHGVAQGDNTFGRRAPIQVCSAQTIEKRGYFPDLDLLIVDECHTQRKAITEFARVTKASVIGLTATPFSKGMGETYTNVVNVTTTNKLIKDGWLAPLKVYAAKAIDMKGAKTQGGEWRDRDVEERGRAIIGDIVAEWQDKTQLHFGGPVKTIVFSATVNHGREICEQFQLLGYNFQQVSYKDGNDDRRRAIIDEFRKADSEITGLVSCEALAKGFDVPDILCGIAARPYRKSFAAHIQMLGRAMRGFPGKEFALWLCHCDNYLGFYGQMLDLFESGVSELDDGELASKVREDPEVRKSQIVCSRCGYVLTPGMETCPSCGAVRSRKSMVENVPGEMIEMGEIGARKPYLADPHKAWREICYNAMLRKKGDAEAANKFARVQYKNFFGSWPKWDLDPAESIDPGLASHIQANVIRWIKGKQKAAA